MQRFLLALGICVLALSVPFPTNNNHIVATFGSVNLQLFETVEHVPTTTVLFAGDVMLARNVERLTNWNGTNYSFERLDVASSTYTVINFEAAIPRVHVPTKDFAFVFSVPESSVQALEEFKVTHAGLANNHSHDFGREGFLHTQEILKSRSVTTFGDVGESASTSITYLEHGTSTVALIALGLVNRQPDNEQVQEIFTTATNNSELQIVYVHWGTEYELNANAAQRQKAVEYISLGADLIIGHHPHVVQPIELINGVPVFYSLGNFVFDQYFSAAVQEGLLVRLSASDSMQIDLIPITSVDRPSSPRVMNADEKEVFLQQLSERSDSSLSEQIIDGTVLLRPLAF